MDSLPILYRDRATEKSPENDRKVGVHEAQKGPRTPKPCESTFLKALAFPKGVHQFVNPQGVIE